MFLPLPSKMHPKLLSNIKKCSLCTEIVQCTEKVQCTEIVASNVMNAVNGF
jgi:hypothetical protein